MGDILRTSPSGPTIEGTVTGDLLSWNATTKSWDKVPASTFQPALPAVQTVNAVAVGALAAAGDNAVVNIPVAGALAGDAAVVISTTLSNSGVVVSGCGVCLAPGTISVEVIATKAYGGANEDFFLMILRP